MKNRLMILVVGMAALSSAAFADVAWNVSVGNEWGRRDAWERPRYTSYYAYPYFHRHPHPYRRLYVAPVVVAPAVYAPPPVYVVPVPTVYSAPSASIGDYGTDLANLKEKLSRLRGVVLRQTQKGQMAVDQSNRFMTTLDGIEHDQHARAYDRGGNLTGDDFADLTRRLNQVSEDLELALAQ